MRYRTDIDGLRAIAILLVLVYHGGLSLFPSGFIGVDIFFVISGYLITGIIHESLNNQNFSFTDFYNRRLWRLQPVFIVLLVMTTVFSLLFFLPDDLIQASRSVRKTSLFLSNTYFSQTTTGYFSPDAHQLPLLHTWSLSIEWQCYLILPLVMYGLYRMLGARKLIVGVYLLTLVCLLLCLHNSKNGPVQTYYQFSSRIFEFLIGACIALTPFNPDKINKFLLHAVGILALGVIFYIAGLRDIVHGYPDWYAFSICMATATLIALGNNPASLASKILSLRPLVFIGVLSYSLYIWHWLIFAILRYQNISESASVLCMAFVATFIVSFLSWRFIERPARLFKQLPFRYSFVSLLVLPILLAHFSAYMINKHSGYPQRFDQELVAIYQTLDRYNSPRRSLCISKNNKNFNTQCLIGAEQAQSKTGLMIGDSFSNHYWGFMDVLGKAAGVSILAQGTSSCIALPEIYLFDWWNFKNTIYKECYDQTARYYRMIKKGHYDYVIIGQIWSNYFSDNIINHLGDKRSPELNNRRLKIALNKAVEIISTSGARPILIKSSAITKGNLHDCFFKHVKLRQPYQTEQCDFILNESEKDKWMDRLFAQLQIKYPQLIVIDPKKVQCQNKLCKAALNGIPVYRDEGHITDYASYQFGTLYLREVGNPFA